VRQFPIEALSSNRRDMIDILRVIIGWTYHRSEHRSDTTSSPIPIPSQAVRMSIPFFFTLLHFDLNLLNVPSDLHFQSPFVKEKSL